MNEYGILHGYTLSGSGTGTALKTGDVLQSLKSDSCVWIHMDANNSASRKFLEKEFGYLDEIILSAIFADETRPRILELEKGTLLILRGINLNENAEPEDMISIRIWIEKDRIISVQRRKMKVVQDLVERLETGKGPKNSSDFITMLISRLFERMEPFFTELDERLDAIEENMIEKPDASDRQEIGNIRKEAIQYRRYIGPQRDVISQLRLSDQPWLEQINKRRLQESYDHVTRYLEDLDTLRERAQVVKDELTNAISERMNNNLYKLSIIAAIFLPLGFLTGLLGINLAGIPGAESGHAFIVFCVVLAFVITLQMWLFKRLGWF